MHRYIPISIPDDFEIGGKIVATATIDSDLIDSTLTNFPVGIDLSASDFISGRSSTDWQRLHCTVGGTECYVEVDVWDMVTPQAIIHVKVPSISSSADTEIKLVFGEDNTTTYVGETGDAAAQAVWDDDFVVVYHMSQDPSGGTDAIKDSTNNSNHGTTSGSMTTDDLIDGTFGKAIEFDGTNDTMSCSITLPSSYNATLFFTPHNIATASAIAAFNWQYSIGYGRLLKWNTSNTMRVYTGSLNDEFTCNLSNDTAFILNIISNDSGSYYVYLNGILIKSGNRSISSKTSLIYLASELASGNYTNMSVSYFSITENITSAWRKATNAVLAKTLVTLS